MADRGLESIMSVSTADPLVTEFQKIVARALEEDLHAGDVTASGTVPAGTQGRARIETREDIVVCGLSLVSQVFATIDPSVRCTFLVEDGARVAAGENLAILEGDARSLLACTCAWQCVKRCAKGLCAAVQPSASKRSKTPFSGLGAIGCAKLLKHC